MRIPFSLIASDRYCLLSSASFADEPLKNELIKQTIYFLENSKARYAFPDWYRSTNGEIFTFKNRTVVGGNFLPLLVKLK